MSLPTSATSSPIKQRDASPEKSRIEQVSLNMKLAEHEVLRDIALNGWKGSHYSERLKLDAFSAAMEVFTAEKEPDQHIEGSMRCLFGYLTDKFSESDSAFHEITCHNVVMDYTQQYHQTADLLQDTTGVYDIDPPVPCGATIYDEKLALVSDVDEVSFEMQVKTKTDGVEKDVRTSPIVTRSKTMSPQKHSTPIIREVNTPTTRSQTRVMVTPAKMRVTPPNNGTKKKVKKSRKSVVASNIEFDEAVESIIKAPIGDGKFYEALKWLANNTYELTKKGLNVHRNISALANQHHIYPRLKLIMADLSYRGDVHDKILFHAAQIAGNICLGTEKVSRRIIEEDLHVCMIALLNEDRTEIVPSWRVRQVLFWGIRDLSGWTGHRCFLMKNPEHMIRICAKMVLITREFDDAPGETLQADMRKDIFYTLKLLLSADRLGTNTLEVLMKLQTHRFKNEELLRHIYRTCILLPKAGNVVKNCERIGLMTYVGNAKFLEYVQDGFLNSRSEKIREQYLQHTIKLVSFCLQNRQVATCQTAYPDLEKMLLFMISLNTDNNPLFYPSIKAIEQISRLNPNFADSYISTLVFFAQNYRSEEFIMTSVFHIFINNLQPKNTHQAELLEAVSLVTIITPELVSKSRLEKLVFKSTLEYITAVIDMVSRFPNASLNQCHWWGELCKRLCETLNDQRFIELEFNSRLHYDYCRLICEYGMAKFGYKSIYPRMIPRKSKKTSAQPETTEIPTASSPPAPELILPPVEFSDQPLCASTPENPAFVMPEKPVSTEQDVHLSHVVPQVLAAEEPQCVPLQAPNPN